VSARTTYELTADRQIKIGSGAICSLTIVTDAANNAAVSLYDVADSGDIAASNKITEITVLAGSNYGGRSWFEPVRFNQGLYADVTGTGASYFVEWRG